MTDAIRENTVQMGSIVNAINKMNENLGNVAQALSSLCGMASNLHANK